MMLPTIVARSAQALIDLAKQGSPRRCETCQFWGQAAGWLSPKGWKRCKKDNKDTSPVYLCDKYQAK